MTSQPPPYPGGNDFGAMPPYAGGGDPYAAGAPTPPGQRRTSGLAIAALVLGIVAIPAALYIIGLLPGILAIIFGIIGIRVGGRPGRSGRGLAIAGLATGVVGVVLGAVLLGVYANKYSKCSKENPGASRDTITQCVRDSLSN